MNFEHGTIRYADLCILQCVSSYCRVYRVVRLFRTIESVENTKKYVDNKYKRKKNEYSSFGEIHILDSRDISKPSTYMYIIILYSTLCILCTTYRLCTNIFCSDYVYKQRLYSSRVSIIGIDFLSAKYKHVNHIHRARCG